MCVCVSCICPVYPLRDGFSQKQLSSLGTRPWRSHFVDTTVGAILDHQHCPLSSLWLHRDYSDKL